MTTLPRPEIPIRSADEHTRRFEQLLEPPVFGARSLWLTWLDRDGLMAPQVVPVDDVPLVPERGLLSGLVQLHNGVAADIFGDDVHLAMALCRPGRPHPTGDDDEWAATLRAVLDGRIVGTWSLHLAAGGTVTPLVEAPASRWH